MTKFEKLLSKYTDAEQYFKTVGYYHVATRASEIETRLLVDNIAERAGYGDDIEEVDVDTFTKHYYDQDEKQLSYAIPRHYYVNKDGNIEISKVEVVWITTELEDGIPTNETEKLIPITENEEHRLRELADLGRDARNDFDAIKRTALTSLFKENGIDDKDLDGKLNTVRDFANELVDVATMQDAVRLQEIQHEQILALEGISDSTREVLIRQFCPKYCEADEATEAKYLACAYSNFVNNDITAIPELFIRESFHRYFSKVRYGDAEADETDLQYYNLIKHYLDANREKVLELSEAWYYEAGGKYVIEEETQTAIEETLPLQRFAESETVITGSFQDYFVPDVYTQDITKPRAIFDKGYSLEELDGVQLEFDILPNANKECFVYVNMSIEASDDIKLTAVPTTFDKAVLDGVNSIYDSGQVAFTAKQVANLLYHGNNLTGSGISPNQIGAVTKSINKLRNIEISIDWTEHARMKGLPEGVKYTRKEHIIPARVETLTKGKNVLEWYTLLEEPPLYSYAKQVKQINSVPIGILNIPQLKMDDEKVALRNYLIEQIGIMKNPNNPKYSRNITINKLLTYAGINVDGITKQVRSKKIKSIEAILQQFKAEKWIKGYEFKKEGRTLYAIEIIL